ncbi:hypothetical protein DFR97_004054 [Clostridium beijerinckii]|nr:hypothetical protein [Clostridium beijerinckii]
MIDEREEILNELQKILFSKKALTEIGQAPYNIVRIF